MVGVGHGRSRDSKKRTQSGGNGRLEIPRNEANCAEVAGIVGAGGRERPGEGCGDGAGMFLRCHALGLLHLAPTMIIFQGYKEIGKRDAVTAANEVEFL